MADATVTCPICKSTAKPLDITGDAPGFDCPRHGKFKVGGTSMVTKKDVDSGQWETALKRAKARTAPELWPVINESDF
jgi:hypothetical protein